MAVNAVCRYVNVCECQGFLGGVPFLTWVSQLHLQDILIFTHIDIPAYCHHLTDGCACWQISILIVLDGYPIWLDFYLYLAILWSFAPIFRCVLAYQGEGMSVRPYVGLSVSPSIGPSINTSIHTHTWVEFLRNGLNWNKIASLRWFKNKCARSSPECICCPNSVRLVFFEMMVILRFFVGLREFYQFLW